MLTLNHRVEDQGFLLSVVLGPLRLSPSFLWFPLGAVDYVEQNSKAIIHGPFGRLINMK